MVDDVVRLLEASINDVFWIASGDLSWIRYITPTVEAVWGLSPEHVLREPRCLFDAIHADDRDRIRDHVTNARDGGDFECEYRIVRPEGSLRWIRERGRAVEAFDGKPRAYACVAQDVTDRKHAEQERDVVADRFQLMGRAMNEGMWDWDIVTNTAWWSDALYTVYGHPRSQEPSYDAWAECIHPEDRARVLAGFDGIIARGERTWTDEYRYVRRDGSVMDIADRGHVLFGDHGRPVRMVGVVKDITQQRALERQLRHAQRMEAVGQLAGGIAHDFNNILLAVSLELALLQATPGVSANVLGHASEIRAVIDRAKSLTRQLLVFSRREAMRPQVIDLNEKVVDLARMLRRLLGEQVSLEIDLAPGALHANVDSSMIDQVLVNLAVNARDAMGRRGRLAITTGSRDATSPAGTPGRYATIAVSDTGCGIAAEHLPRIFDPFFTTKHSSGTGLGLATAHGIIEQHGGWIEVETEVGRGSTFRVYLPLSDDLVVPRMERPATVPTRGRERILLVEDDASVRRGLRTLLEQTGYDVVDADCAATALDAWEEQSGRFDLVITDLMMPGGLNGRELAERLVAKCPPLRVLFITGHDRELARGLPYHILHKPFDPDQLLAIIRASFDG